MSNIFPRFSVRTLLLATLLLAMALSIGLLLWELMPLRAEVQQLRNEAGYLTVDDPSKLQAIRLDSDSPLVWRWKVWIPKGRGTIFVNAMVGDIPEAGDFVKLKGGAGVTRGRDQEAVVTVMVYQDLHQEWTLSCEIGGAQIRRTLSAEEVAAIRDKSGYSREGVSNTTQAGDDSEHFILLRERFAAPGAKSVDFRDLDTAGDGMLVWLQAEEKP